MYWNLSVSLNTRIFPQLFQTGSDGGNTRVVCRREYLEQMGHWHANSMVRSVENFPSQEGNAEEKGR